jgi:hypothetical protein
MEKDIQAELDQAPSNDATAEIGKIYTSVILTKDFPTYDLIAGDKIKISSSPFDPDSYTVKTDDGRCFTVSNEVLVEMQIAEVQATLVIPEGIEMPSHLEDQGLRAGHTILLGKPGNGGNLVPAVTMDGLIRFDVTQDILIVMDAMNSAAVPDNENEHNVA